MIIRRSRSEIVDFSEDDNDDSIKSYCKHCQEYGFQVPLQNRIYPKGEPVPADHENWKQCLECGEVYPTYTIELESSIKDVVETTESPFDSGIDFLGIDSRTSIGGRKARKKRNKPTYPEKEIQREIDQHRIDAVNIIYDSSGL